MIDPEKRGYPATPEERDKLQRSLIHFQISNYVAADTPLDEAKRRLIQRYERRLKQLIDVPPAEINAAFLDSFAASLDPHSNYLSADVLEDFRISMTLSLEGIGVALAERDGYAVAERIIPGGAADRQKGLKPKDKIIAVSQADGKPVDIIDMPLRDAVALIRGKKGTKVGLTVLRQGEKTERFSIEIMRDTIDLEDQAAKLRFETREVDGKPLKLAVLELPSFYGDADPTKRQCTDDVARLLAQVKQEKADGLLLDLSRNGGGLLQHAVEISGFFVRKGEVVAIENGRGQKQVLRDPDRSILYAGPARRAHLAGERLGRRDRRRRAQGLPARGDRRRRSHLREGHGADRLDAAAGRGRAQDHDRSVLPAGRPVDPALGRAVRRGDALVPVGSRRRVRREDAALFAAAGEHLALPRRHRERAGRPRSLEPHHARDGGRAHRTLEAPRRQPTRSSSSCARRSPRRRRTTASSASPRS